ncbi:MAG TPA: hypothetical protein PK431_02155 [Chitinophagales bacterium]|nr:hypothetical protein [Chitinophagales bacterium]
MKLHYKLLVSLLITSFFVYGNETSDFYKQKLSENGITLNNSENSYSDYQYYLLESFDFTAYRNYNSIRLIQIEDGPIIQLSSLLEMQQLGKTIPTKFLEDKKDEVVSSNLKSIITLVNIGFRYGPKKHTETGF